VGEKIFKVSGNFFPSDMLNRKHKSDEQDSMNIKEKRFG